MENKPDIKIIDDLFDEWSKSLKPLFHVLKSFESVKKVKKDDLELIQSYISKSGAACQKIIDHEYKLKEALDLLDSQITETEKLKTQKDIELNEIDEKLKLLRWEIMQLEVDLDEKRTGKKVSGQSVPERSSQDISFGISDVDIVSGTSSEQFIPDIKYSIETQQNGVITEGSIKVQETKQYLEMILGLLEVEINHKKSKSQDLNTRIEEKAFFLEKMESRMKNLQEDMDEINRLRNEIDSEIQKYQSQISKVDASIDKTHLAEISYYNEIYLRVQKDTDGIFNLLNLKITKLYNKLHTIEKTITKKQKDFNNLNNKFKEEQSYSDKVYSTITKKLSVLELENNNLKSILREYEEKNGFPINRLSEVTPLELSNGKADLRKIINTDEFGESEKIRLETEIDDLKRKKDEYEMQVEEIKRMNENMKSRMINEAEKEKFIKSSVIEEQTGEYRKDLSASRNETITENSEIEDLKSMNSDLIHEIEIYRQKIQELEAQRDAIIQEFNEKNSEVEKLIQRKSEYEKIISDIEKVNSSLVSKLNERDTLIQELEEKLKKV